MKWPLVALLALLVVPGCGSEPAGLDSDQAELRWGSSFGMCGGYCRRELEISRGGMRLTTSSWDPAHYPTKVEERPLPAGAWDALDAALRQSQLERLDSVYGCPDCADGGAEWVELAAPDLKKRVAFEYGKAPSPLQPLLDRIVELRAQFPQ